MTIQSFYDAIVQQRDPYEGTHGMDVARLAEKIAEMLGLPPEEITLLKVAAHLHDIGKIGLPENLLNKPGRFTRPEFVMVQQHTNIGVELIRPFHLGPIINDVILHHHERFDGDGYPHRLRGKSLLVHPDIVHIADIYDALVNERPYRPQQYAPAEAFHLITSDRTAHNPQVLEAFAEVIKSHQYE